MQFRESDAVGDEGVAAVNMVFSRELRWIFREVSKRDVGVDAQVAPTQVQSRLTKQWRTKSLF
jgi:hypothetical protein